MAIVSFKHRFIFIKTRKTAGTSIEVHLANQCADEDIVTPLYPPVVGHTPRNYQTEASISSFYNHMPASRIQELCPETFSRSFRFCFERHPVDKCLSHFAMLRNSPLHRKAEHPATWEAYLERGFFPVDTALYVDQQGALLVDKIYRYEELASSLADISARTGIPYAPLSAQEKSGFRYGVPPFSEVMASVEQRRLIFDAFSSTLRFIDYPSRVGCP